MPLPMPSVGGRPEYLDLAPVGVGVGVGAGYNGRRVGAAAAAAVLNPSLLRGAFTERREYRDERLSAVVNPVLDERRLRRNGELMKALFLDLPRTLNFFPMLICQYIYLGGVGAALSAVTNGITLLYNNSSWHQYTIHNSERVVLCLC